VPRHGATGAASACSPRIKKVCNMLTCAGVLDPMTCRGAPLFVGSVPGNTPAAYSALLAYKPDKPGPGAAAMVASQMASRCVARAGRGASMTQVTIRTAFVYNELLFAAAARQTLGI
jgi:hypothetical protein